MYLFAVLLSLLFFLLFFYIVFVIFFTRQKAPSNAIIINEAQNNKNPLPQKIDLISWNIGYGGLGKESDFFIDGGKNILPKSKNLVKKNLAGIKKILTQIRGDIFLLQEVSTNKSLLSRNVEILTEIAKLFHDYFIIFRPDIATWGAIFPLKITHGTLTIAKERPIKTKIITLPYEDKPLGGIFRRHYALQVNYFPIKGKKTKQWVIVNLHLAAFDDGAKTRFEQLKAVFDFALKEYKNGNYVILGGDWNIELKKTNFPHQTKEEYLFWKFTLPKDVVPKNWQIVIDENNPTARSNYQPFIEGENYTAIIDGFIISPNVKIDKINTLNNGFEFTDHLPVIASFSTK